MLIRQLEPRYFDANQTIFGQQEEVLEMYFIEPKMSVLVGHEIWRR